MAAAPHAHPSAARATGLEDGAGRSPGPPKPWAAIERPTEVHLHLHGVSAEDIAAILARRQDGPG
jgi:hypothetical protein